ncbi:YlxR family protein [Nocardioidaceae bacterium]|nr:YlxR family protein [Nocardioidaceae bacterium]
MGQDSVDRAPSAGRTSAGGPVRTCIGCREKAPRRDLLRVVAGSDARAVPDPTRTAPGRGAHLHPTQECLDLAVRRRALGRALRVPGGLDPDPVLAHLARQQDQHDPRDQQDQQGQ